METINIDKTTVRVSFEKTGNTVTVNQAEDLTRKSKAGVAAVLRVLGYVTLPNALQGLDSKDISNAEVEFAAYLVYDDDFGGAWKDDDQINNALT